MVASVFVNPTQFGPNEDFAPLSAHARSGRRRTARRPAATLLWLPTVEAMYPFGVDGARAACTCPASPTCSTARTGPAISTASRTVVARLFNQVQPDVAVFGRKDYQQLAVIRYMVARPGVPGRDRAGADTVREADGLAMSSRNQYLSADERAGRAGRSIARLLAMREARARPGSRVRRSKPTRDARCARPASWSTTPWCARADLSRAGGRRGRPRVALIAARLGRTRLIDNLEFDAG